MAIKTPKARTIIPASPGTRAIVFGMRGYDAVPDDDQPVFDRTELTVIAWAIQEVDDNEVGVERWAEPVFSQPIFTEGLHVIVHPDGKPDFPHPFPNYEEGKGTTIAEFEKY